MFYRIVFPAGERIKLLPVFARNYIQYLLIPRSPFPFPSLSSFPILSQNRAGTASLIYKNLQIIFANPLPNNPVDSADIASSSAPRDRSRSPGRNLSKSPRRRGGSPAKGTGAGRVDNSGSGSRGRSVGGGTGSGGRRGRSAVGGGGGGKGGGGGGGRGRGGGGRK